MNSKSKLNLFDNIKSKYIFEIVFSYVPQNEGLLLIRYNKRFQSKLEVDIEAYKKISGKYKIEEKNGIVKEFTLDKNLLIFEGEYKDGKRNGKGKEFHEYNGVIKFEGEYLNGKRINGFGFNLRGEKEFEIKNGNGTIKEYYNNGELKYEGEIVNNQKSGKGKYYYDNGVLAYEGEYLYGQKHGEGIEYNIHEYPVFVGEFKNDRKWIGEFLPDEDEVFFGYQILKYHDLTRELNLFDKIEDNHDDENLFLEGMAYYYNGEYIYKDKNSNICKNGYGKEYYYDGQLKYEGEFVDGRRNGKGKEYYRNNKLKFSGEFVDGYQWNGNGYNLEGEKVYELKDGKGLVKEFNKFGELEYEGEYLNGVRNGFGKLYDCSNIITGNFLNGEIVKGEKYINDFGSLHLTFKGEYFDFNEWEGNKIIYQKYQHKYNKVFEGKLLKGQINGKGKEYYHSTYNKIIMFEGEYLNGKRFNGIGFNLEGEPVFKIKDGFGEIKEYYDNNRLKFECEYKNGKINGKGKEYYINGKLKFEGEFISERKNYFDIEFNRFNSFLEQDRVNIKMWNGTGFDFNGNEIFKIENGKGVVKIYDNESGNLIFQGEYQNGEPWNGIFYKKNGIDIYKEIKDGKNNKYNDLIY